MELASDWLLEEVDLMVYSRPIHVPYPAADNSDAEYSSNHSGIISEQLPRLNPQS